MVTVSPSSTALISSGSLFLASATLTFILSMIAISYSYVNSTLAVRREKSVHVLFKNPLPLVRRPTTAILIRARSVVQVHPGPPFKSADYRVLPQKPQPTIQPTLHCTIYVSTP